jgi:hypothetical protein
MWKRKKDGLSAAYHNLNNGGSASRHSSARERWLGDWPWRMRRECTSVVTYERLVGRLGGNLSAQGDSVDASLFQKGPHDVLDGRGQLSGHNRQLLPILRQHCVQPLQQRVWVHSLRK